MLEWILLLFRLKKQASTENKYQSPYREPGVVGDVFEPEAQKPEPKPVVKKDSVFPKIMRFIVEHFWDFFWVIVIIGVIGFIGWKVHSCIQEPPAEVHHCYISYSTSNMTDEEKEKGLFYSLMGYRHHANDLTMGKYQTFGLAVDAAELISCPLK